MLMGEGTRLAGKPFLKVRGKPLFLYGWETLSKLFDKVLVSCTPKVEEKLKTFKVDYVVDEKMLGPLSGILSAN